MRSPTWSQLFSIITAFAVSVSALPAPAPQNNPLPGPNIVGTNPDTEYPYGASDVSIIRSSHAEVYSSRYSFESTITVELAVKNKAFNKQVGIRFTNDSWSTMDEAFGSYKGRLDNIGYEVWTVTIKRGQRPAWTPTPEYEVAAFVSYNRAARVWDPKNNFFICEYSLHLIARTDPLEIRRSTCISLISLIIAMYHFFRPFHFFRQQSHCSPTHLLHL
jgi:hypothetical protein